MHGIVHGDVLPHIYILMANKTEENCNKLLSELKALEPILTPSTIIVDVEGAAINAFSKVFPNSVQRGCFFISRNVYFDLFNPIICNSCTKVMLNLP